MEMTTNLQSVVDSLEAYKRWLGRRFDNPISYSDKVSILTCYNKVENEIRYLVNVFGLTRNTKPYKLTLRELK
jgi:hypothetical protein